MYKFYPLFMHYQLCYYILIKCNNNVTLTWFYENLRLRIAYFHFSIRTFRVLEFLSDSLTNLFVFPI